MANPAFASGFTSSFGGVLLDKLKRDHDDEIKQKQTTLEALTLLMNSGRVRDFSSLTPMFESILGTTGKKGKGKGAGAGAGGNQDPMALMRTMIGGSFGGGGEGGTSAPGAPAQTPASGTPPAAGAGPSATPAPAQGAPTATPAPAVVLPTSTFGKVGGGPGVGVQDQPKPSFFLSQEEVDARAAALEESKAEGTERAAINVAPEKKAMIDRLVAGGMPVSAAYSAVGLKPPTAVVADKDLAPDAGSATGWVRVYRDADGNIVRQEPAEPPAGARGGSATAFTGQMEQDSEARYGLLGKDKYGKDITDPVERQNAIDSAKEFLASQANKDRIVVATAAKDAKAAEGPPDSTQTFLDWAGRPDTPDIMGDPYKRDRWTGLTPASVYQGGITYAVMGPSALAGFGLASSGHSADARMAVRDKGDALIQAAGVSQPVLVEEYHALAAADKNRINQYTAAVGAADSAIGQMDLLKATAGQLARGDSQWVNGIKQAFQKNFTADQAAQTLSQTQLYVYTAARDYAKVSTGSAASISPPTDQAIAAVDRILAASQPQAVMAANIEGMQREMRIALNKQWGEIQAIQTATGELGKSTIGQFLRAVAPPPPGSNVRVPDTGAGTGGGPGTGGGAAPPKFTVAQVVTIRGKQMTITKVYPDGTFDAVPVIKK